MECVLLKLPACFLLFYTFSAICSVFLQTMWQAVILFTFAPTPSVRVDNRRNSFFVGIILASKEALGKWFA